MEAARRRTFAVISHPDAGKSTLTEALALHAKVIGEAGAVHGKSGRRGVVSDWMEMERSRGISITSAALQFSYRDHVVNLLDTPGHADFSEDTYRVLAAVDGAVMLIDAAKGLEPQTLKLAEVCRLRGVPMITLINKWDRPGHEPLALLDEITERLGLAAAPLNWPVGVAGEFHGLLDRTSGDYLKLTRTPGGATIAREDHLTPDEALAEQPDAWLQAVEEDELLTESGLTYDAEAYLAGKATPVLFGAAVLNFGVRHLLDTLIDLAPAPTPRADREGHPHPLDAPFSGFVFKIQAGMDAAHRDRVAFVRVCSGTFQRGMVVTHAGTGKPFATKYAQSMFGRDRSTVDTAYPGDVIGLVNASSLTVGDTLYSEEPVSTQGSRSSRPSISRWREPETAVGTSSFDAACTNSSRKGLSRCSARIGAATRHRSSPPSGPCSSRSPSTGWSTSSGRRFPWSGWTIRSPGAPMRTPPSSSPRITAPRCCSAPTASCWPCSPTAGGCRTSRGNGPMPCWNHCPPTSSPRRPGPADTCPARVELE